jgi:hypothetical protein
MRGGFDRGRMFGQPEVQGLSVHAYGFHSMTISCPNC